MKDRQKSIDLLNKAVGMELQAVHQYMYWHFHLDDQGYQPLSALLRRTAIEEMLHTEGLAERILFLKGDVKMVVAGPVEIITEPEKIIQRAMEMEEESANAYNQFALDCAMNADSGTKQIFETMVADEERHGDEFDIQLDHLRRLGPNYLALQAFGNAGPNTPTTPAE